MPGEKNNHEVFNVELFIDLVYISQMINIEEHWIKFEITYSKY